MVTLHTFCRSEDKVTVVPFDEISRRQRGVSEACFLHVAGSDERQMTVKIAKGVRQCYFV